jgi:hypothetical protein
MIFAINSATLVTDAMAGHVVVTGSHGSIYPAYLLARRHLRGAILHDAGPSRDNSGSECLRYLEGLGVAAAVIDYLSARIGDGPDMLERGIVSGVNAVAAALGCAPGQACGDAAECMTRGTVSDVDPPPYEEARWLLENGPVPVWGLDSISLVKPTDAGAVVISGSHGALIGPPRSAVTIDVAAAVFHDAGIGRDNAGISRLPALDQLGIGGVAVAASSARIGHAQSLWQTGLVSAINRKAAGWGAKTGMSVQEFARLAVKACQSAVQNATAGNPDESEGSF